MVRTECLTAATLCRPVSLRLQRCPGSFKTFCARKGRPCRRCSAATACRCPPPPCWAVCVAWRPQRGCSFSGKPWQVGSHIPQQTRCFESLLECSTFSAAASSLYPLESKSAAVRSLILVDALILSLKSAPLPACRRAGVAQPGGCPFHRRQPACRRSPPAGPVWEPGGRVGGAGGACSGHSGAQRRPASSRGGCRGGCWNFFYKIKGSPPCPGGLAKPVEYCCMLHT